MMFFRFRTVTKEDDETYKVTMVGAIPNTMLRLLSTTSLFVVELLMRSPMASPQSRIGVWLIKSPVQSFRIGSVLGVHWVGRTIEKSGRCV